MFYRSFADHFESRYVVGYKEVDSFQNIQTLLTLNNRTILKYYSTGIADPTQLYSTLNETVPWKTNKVIMHGRELNEARETCLMATDDTKTFTSSNTQKTVIPVSEPITLFVNELTLQGLLADRHAPNLFLLNRYSPTQYICEHADDETDMDSTQSIWSLSLGQTRTLVIREKPSIFKCLNTGKRKWRLEIPMYHGSLLEFCPTMQDWFTHEVIKSRKSDKVATEPFEYRINVTARVYTS